MSSRDFDLDVVTRRLTLLRDLLDDLGGVGPVDADRLTRDRMLRHAVERVITQIVELAVDINGHVASTWLGKAPSDYATSFDLAATAAIVSTDLAAELKPSAGLRNVLVHEYVNVDLQLLAAAVPLTLDGYGRYVTSVGRALLS